MANNRLFIRCKGCSGFMSFAKFYPTEQGQAGWDSHIAAEDFNNFFDKHDPHNKMDDYGSFYDLMDDMDERVELYDYANRKIIMEKPKSK